VSFFDLPSETSDSSSAQDSTEYVGLEDVICNEKHHNRARSDSDSSNSSYRRHHRGERSRSRSIEDRRRKEVPDDRVM
jgi:hypothetical protein